MALQQIANAFRRPRLTKDSTQAITGTPSWDASTTCLAIIHSVMSAQGWHRYEHEIPMFDGAMEELPRRPLALEVGRGCPLDD